jgi:hypothetical protein
MRSMQQRWLAALGVYLVLKMQPLAARLLAAFRAFLRSRDLCAAAVCCRRRRHFFEPGGSEKSDHRSDHWDWSIGALRTGRS